MAEKAFPAEGFHIYGHAVAYGQSGNLAAKLYDLAHHFMADHNAGNSFWNAAMFNVQVAGAYGCQSDFNNGVLRMDDGRDLALLQGKLSLPFIYDSIHHGVLG